ncbi:efflux RND transporter permease subunit [Martelella endophytica]|uniref:ACR family transporter n=1 Tax=Martelella endophytica TaxID=1486262 RepID=A0A0D5LN11_MAREN|nr:efflux RND transporter permease subunit [Martelella endophytica]AJY45516.1 ACR family transporter [Martelella endophytica]
MDNKFNLSTWALEHRSLVWYLMAVFMAAGLLSYINLGREEDPSFTIRTMTVQVGWPGASAEEMTRQVTDRIEKKLEELDELDRTRSMTTAGQAIVYVDLQDNVDGADVQAIWQQVRNMIGDIKQDFPQGVNGPFFNDRFGDVYGNIYAFTADGLTERQLRDYVDEARNAILTLDNVGDVDVIGEQDEVIYIEFSPRKLAALGLDTQSVLNALKEQNAVTASGVIETGEERIALRVGGAFSSEESLRAVNLRVNDRFFPLGDVAEIKRGYVDPPQALFRVNGEPAIGLAIGMRAGANLLKFGAALDQEIDAVVAQLPAGVNVFHVADQPEVVDEAVSGFTRALFEAVAIVLVISFISLGVRAGLVVAIAIPLVLAITFAVMYYSGISLQRISLGGLIIALGLLVDDAMIAVEMMVHRLEKGDSLDKAATHVYTSTAFPMLTGTLVTVAGFMPVGLNSSNAGEFIFTLFVVIAVSLIVSWIVAVFFTPLIGVTVMPKTMKQTGEHRGFVMRTFRRLLLLCLRFRWVTIVVTLLAFAASVYGYGFVQHQFFPDSDRVELIVDWNLPQNSSIEETNRQIAQFEEEALKGNALVDHWSSYIGEGAPRFILSFDVQPPGRYFGQTVIVTRNLDDRDELQGELQTYLDRTFPGTDAFVKLLAIGPPVGKPVAYRISGPDIQKTREYAQEIAVAIGKNPNLGRLTMDWYEPSRMIKVDVLQDQARKLGISSEDIATALNGMTDGTTATQVRDDIYLVDVVARANDRERGSIDTLENLELTSANGESVPLGAVAKFRYELEQPVIWRRDRIPTISVEAAIVSSLQAATVVEQLDPTIEELKSELPPGYRIELGGTEEKSAEANAPIIAVVPLMLFVMATVLMIQLQSVSRMLLVFSVAPLALIGVVMALFITGAPMGFVAILGVLALIGILIRNSVILIVQIEDHRKEGMKAWEAVVEATENRMRPIMLTAAAATLALIPIAREIFWGPMAVAMMGGIIVGTLLTLLFLPALYVTWFGIRPERDAS